MRRFLIGLLAVVGILIVCVPITLITTFLLTPLWSWIEARHGIESLGHSGPAEWCFVAIYGALVTVSLAILALLTLTHRKRQRQVTRGD